MKKIVQYVTTDGQTLSTWALAKKHETGLVRRRLVSEYMLKMLKLGQGSETTSGSQVIDVLLAHAEEFKRLLSARHAQRTAKLSGAKRTKKTL